MVDQLKVTQTAIRTGNSFILISNINIPLEYLDNTQPIIERLKNFITNEYRNTQPVYYEVTATYQLRHRETNSVRQWLGSFSPRIGPMLFEAEIFSEFNFVANLTRTLNVNFICEKLLAANSLDSDWVFDQLYSVIIHVSSMVPKEYHVLYRRNLLHGSGTRRSVRKVANFDLP